MQQQTEIEKEYEYIAKFLGYTYFPYSDKKTVQFKEYPGWFNTVNCTNSDNSNNQDRVFTYTSKAYVCRTTSDLNFRNDYNQLLKIVEYIEKLQDRRHGGFKVIIDDDCCLIHSKNKTKIGIAYSKMYCGKNDKKEAIYQSCLMFIGWYNKPL